MEALHHGGSVPARAFGGLCISMHVRGGSARKITWYGGGHGRGGKGDHERCGGEDQERCGGGR